MMALSVAPFLILTLGLLSISSAGAQSAGELAAKWRVNVVQVAETQDGTGLDIAFDHGTEGTTGYKIYGRPGGVGAEGDPMTGSSCRSLGGELVDASIDLYVGEDYTFPESAHMAVSVDWNNVVNNPMIHLAGNEAGSSVVLFCFLFFVANPAGEEVNYAEVEIQIIHTEDGNVQFSSIQTAARSPESHSFVEHVAVWVSVCAGTEVPQKQGDVLSLCLGADDATMNVDGIQSFSFEGSTGVVQEAFRDYNPANDLTGGEPCDSAGGECEFRFHTLLQASFFSGTATAVTGHGICNLAAGGRGRSLKDNAVVAAGHSEEDEIEVTFHFLVGDDTSLPDGGLASRYSTLSSTAKETSTKSSVLPVVAPVPAQNAKETNVVPAATKASGSTDALFGILVMLALAALVAVGVLPKARYGRATAVVNDVAEEKEGERKSFFSTPAFGEDASESSTERTIENDEDSEIWPEIFC